MHASRETALVQTDPMDAARAELLAEAIADVPTRARCYLREPADASWQELLEALTRTYGDDETYDLLLAVTIHSQTGQPLIFLESVTRCFYCHRFVWPWQRQGHRYVTAKNLWRWHRRCWHLRRILPQPMPPAQTERLPDARPATYRRS